MTVAKLSKYRSKKPYPELPLFVHNNGQWCRKINGKIHSFGKWEEELPHSTYTMPRPLMPQPTFAKLTHLKFGINHVIISGS